MRYGVAECQRLGFWFAGPAPLTLRINPLRTSRTAYLEALQAAGVTAEAGERPVERAREPRRALLARERRAAPFVGAVEEPDAGKVERGRDGGDLGHVR